MGTVSKNIPASSLAHWAEPIIADEIFAIYEKILGGRSQYSEYLANTHLRMCHFALKNELTAAGTVRKTLLSDAAALHVYEDSINLVEQAVLRILASVVGKNRLRAVNGATRTNHITRTETFDYR
jgi:hypothetical protein